MIIQVKQIIIIIYERNKMNHFMSCIKLLISSLVVMLLGLIFMIGEQLVITYVCIALSLVLLLMGCAVGEYKRKYRQEQEDREREDEKKK